MWVFFKKHNTLYNNNASFKKKMFTDKPISFKSNKSIHQTLATEWDLLDWEWQEKRGEMFTIAGKRGSNKIQVKAKENEKESTEFSSLKVKT